MSTRVGIIAEGAIDLALLPPILRRIAEGRAGVTWPVQIADAFEWLQMRPRGHGGVWMAIRRIVRVLERQPDLPYAFLVILLDRRTQKFQQKVRKLIAGKDRFVLAVDQEEIEAQCPRQFPPFCRETAQAFRRTKSQAGRPVQGTLDLN